MSSNTSFLTLERNTIKYMLGYVEAYEQIKKKEHKEFKTARAFFCGQRYMLPEFL